jgi:hypothetical protein
MQTEQGAIGLIKKNIEDHLHDEISKLVTVPEVLQALKDATDIIDGSSIEAYTTWLWRLELKDMKDSPIHVAKFNHIVRQREANDSLPRREGVKRAFIKSIKGLLPNLAETLQNSKKYSLNRCQTKLKDRAKSSIVDQVVGEKFTTEAMESKPQSSYTEKSTKPVKKPRVTSGIGSWAMLKNFKSLEEVDRDRLMVWESHRDPDHECEHGTQCWFKQGELPIVKLFLSSRKRLKTNKPNPFNRDE